MAINEAGRSLILALLAYSAAAASHGRLRARPASGAAYAVGSTPTRAAGAATQYIGEVAVGTPQQKFRVIFDTASGTVVLPTTRCEDAACMSHRRFVSESSTSATQIGWADDPTKGISKDEDRDTKSLSLLGADVSGEFIRDTACVGQGAQLCSPIDFVGLTEESSEPFSPLEFDGVVGLAPSSADAREFNFLRGLLGGRRPAESVFSLYLSASGGELTFGGYPAERATTALLWAPLLSNNSWRIQVDDVAVGGKRVGLCEARGCEASIDSGSSLIMASGNLLWALMRKLGIDDDCSTEAPPLAFIVRGQLLELNMEDYVERDESGGCRLLFGSTTSAEKAPALVLGYPFLRKFFTVFDSGQSRIGFALANHAAVSPGAGSQKAKFSTVQLKSNQA